MSKGAPASPSQQDLKKLSQGDFQTHRLYFENGGEIDLAKSNFISAAKPKGTQRNAIQSRTMMSQTNRTPGPRRRQNEEQLQAMDDNPATRMASLLSKHGTESSLRARHASAHVESEPEKMMVRQAGQKTPLPSQFMETKRFHQNLSSARKQQESMTSLHNAVVMQHKAAARNRNNSMLTLPPVVNNKADDTFRRVAPSRPADQLLSSLHIGGLMDDLDAQYFDKRSIAQSKMLHRDSSQNPRNIHADQYSSRLSDHEKNSQYHIDLVEEKREEIQNIIRKRQRRAALSTLVSQNDASGKATMTGYIGHSVKKKEYQLPEIVTSPQKTQRPEIKLEDGDIQLEIGSPTFIKRSGEDDDNSSVSGAATVENEEQRIERLEFEVNNQNGSKPTGKFGKMADDKVDKKHMHPELETMKRANRKVNVKADDGVDKHEKRVAQVQKKLFKLHSVPQNPVPVEQPGSPIRNSMNQQVDTQPADGVQEHPQKAQQAEPDIINLAKSLIEGQTRRGIERSQTTIGGPNPGKIQKEKEQKQRYLDQVSISHSPAGLASPTARTGKGDPGTPRYTKTPGASRVSTPEVTVLSGTYKRMADIMDPSSALRIQKMVKQSKANADKLLLEFAGSQETNGEDEMISVEPKTVTDSSLVYEMAQREEFNSELDLYSEIDSAYFKQLKRRGTIIRVPEKITQAIAEEDSDIERDSRTSNNSQTDGEKKAEGDEDEDEDESVVEEETKRESAFDERDVIKANILQKAKTKKDDLDLMGPRLTKKLDEFIFQVSVEAGMPEDMVEQAQAAANGNEETKDEMLRTGNTSLFQLEKTKNDDQGVFANVMDRYVTEFRSQQAFFQVCKMAKDSRFTDPTLNNPLVQYYNECTKANTVAKPLLSKIVDRRLVLRDMKLNTGDAMGLRDAFTHHTNLISKLFLDNNCMSGPQLSAIIQGLGQQKEVTNLTIQGNTVDSKAVEQISALLKRRVPNNLQELHLLHAKCVWRATDELVRSMRSRNYLRKLSLVEAGLNDFSMEHVCEVVRTQKSLQSLDISWNQLMPYQMRPLLEILQKNRRLTNLNLAWNNIMEVGSEADLEWTVEEINQMLGKIIKHSRTMIHMNLTGTGLSAGVIYEIGTCLRRARSVLVIHLSGNPGLTAENMDYLSDRVKCRPREDVERFTRVSGVVKGVLRGAGAISNIMNGIKVKVQRDGDFRQINMKDPIEFSANDQLIFQRMLGHRAEQPGSGQWYESSKNSVACKSHYKNECWICQGHVYSILFWSKGQCYKMNPILSADKTEEVRFEIDRDFGEEEEKDLMHENGNVKYSQLADQVPYVCGSFTGWRYRKMDSLEEFNRRFEKEPVDPFEIACSQGKVRKRVHNREQCNDYEKRYVEIAELEEKLRYTYAWRHFFAENLRYKRPYCMNSHLYYERPSEDGTIPEDDGVGEVFSDSSDEDSDDKKVVETKVPEKAKIKLSSLSLEEQEAMRAAAAEAARYPIPPLPDVNKFDKVFILPMFCKPGKHQYMVKYKDTKESKQSHLKKIVDIQEKRYYAAKAGKAVSQPFNKIKYRKAKKDLMPECFFYQCEVPRRPEDIPPFTKEMQSKVVTRSFDKEVSLFGKWKQDSPGSLATACAEDIKHWKGYRFIKIEEERADTEAVLKKYFSPLKDIFIHLAATSAWPNIGQLDFADFATKAKFLDQHVNISSIDRTFIAANLKVEGASAAAPSNGLKRFEFLEILVRLANIKYLESKIVKTYAEATEKLMVECILPYFTPEPWQEFRDKELWTIDVNDMLEANLENLNKIYEHYRTPTKKLLEYEDALLMCTRDTNLDISEKDIAFCFGYCKMTVSNEERHWKQYGQLQFVEFLEFIGRLAHARFKNASSEMSSQPLVSKIEFLLDDLMQGFSLTRYDVNIDQQEFSESDDDY